MEPNKTLSDPQCIGLPGAARGLGRAPEPWPGVQPGLRGLRIQRFTGGKVSRFRKICFGRAYTIFQILQKTMQGLGGLKDKSTPETFITFKV